MIFSHFCSRIVLPKKEESKDQAVVDSRQEAHRLSVIKKHEQTFAQNIKKMKEQFSESPEQKKAREAYL